jgi:hypothetical protein
MTPCALCGKPILDNPSDPNDKGTDEHVPPLQFFPKAIRPQLCDMLWTVPSHRRCNQSYKLDEEYFLHYFYPLVAFQNEPMGKVLLEELKRRAKKPQSRALIRRMLKERTHASPGGIILPPGLVRVNFDLVRIQNVAVKIAKCLFYRDHGRYLPRSRCVHVELCEKVTDLQPFFAELWLVREFENQSAAPDVFRYWHYELDGQHYYAMLFWDAFMFCMIFQDPAKPDAHEG